MTGVQTCGRPIVVSFRRVRQLADVDTALVDAAGAEVTPKFNQGGVEAERAEVRSTNMPAWEARGWQLREPVERLWNGERELAALTAGCDANSAAVVELLLTANDDETGRLARKAHKKQAKQQARAAARARGGGGGSGGGDDRMKTRTVKATGLGGRSVQAEVQSNGDFRSEGHLRALRRDFAKNMGCDAAEIQLEVLHDSDDSDSDGDDSGDSSGLGGGGGSSRRFGGAGHRLGGDGGGGGGGHSFARGRCMVCVGCGDCTGFGTRCCMHRAGRPRGVECGCGAGDQGCTGCGLCRACCSASNLRCSAATAGGGAAAAAAPATPASPELVAQIEAMGFTAERATAAIRAVGQPDAAAAQVAELAIEWLFANPETEAAAAATGQAFIPTATPAAAAAPAPQMTPAEMRAQRLARFSGGAQKQDAVQDVD
eukprot:SAG22_NODE_3513_length_1669_cov_1.893631_1_plen_429_part_00